MLSASDRDKTIYYKVLHFLESHRDEYSPFEFQGILNYSMRPNIKTIAKTDLIREIYDKLGLIPDDLNIYVAFMKLIEEKFGIDGRNIFEVGGGVFPMLGERIHLKQKTGSITVFDPRLSSTVHGSERFILKKELFGVDTPVDDTDLLIGLMPCKGAEPLLESAVQHRKDFMLWFCEGGPHGDYFDYYESDDEWFSCHFNHAVSGVEKNGMGKIKVIELPEFSPYPIIYNQR